MSCFTARGVAADASKSKTKRGRAGFKKISASFERWASELRMQVSVVQ